LSPGAALPDDLRRFILTSVPSVPFLEALLLLRGRPDYAWSVAEVARALYVPEATAEGVAQALREVGLVEPDAAEAQRLHYRPRDAALAAMVDRLAEAYRVDLIGVTRLIHDRVQKNATRFADAFRLRKGN
jgi:DNA-binding IclR family transcriptional regulator